jgi:hypothetical protein
MSSMNWHLSLLALIFNNYSNPNTDLPTFSMDILKSAKYHYEALAQEREIRVLVLEPGRADDYLKCHLKHVSLDDPLPYEALSYFWGDPNKKDQIHCGNGTLSVTINLHSALRHIRAEETERVVWADAVCEIVIRI